MAGHAHVCHARPGVSPEARHADLGDRPRQALRLVVRLRHVSRAKGRRARRRGETERALRQAAGRGRGLDSPGRQGPPHAQRRPRAGAQGDAKRTQPAAGSGGAGEAHDSGGGPQRQPRVRGRQPLVQLRRPADPLELLHRHPPRRQGGHHRPQRRRKDHAPAAPARAARARPGHRQTGHTAGRGLLRPAPRTARRREINRRQHRRRQRHRHHRRPATAHHRLPARFSFFAGAVPHGGAIPVGR